MGDSRADQGHPQPLLRRARASDLPQVLSIESDTFSDPWSLSSFRSSLHTSGCDFQVAVLDGSVVGYTVAMIAPPDGDLQNIAVRSDLRGRGIGWLLLSDLISRSRGAGVRSLYLEVRASNAAAIALYQRAGFTAAGVRSRYYSNPSESALIMRLEIGHDRP